MFCSRTRAGSRQIPCLTFRYKTTSTSAPSAGALALTCPLETWRANVALGKIRYDESQMRVMIQLRNLHRKLWDYQPPHELYYQLDFLSPSRSHAAEGSIEEGWFGSSSRRQTAAQREKAVVRVLKSADHISNLSTPKGFFLIGEPGSGKSLLMKMFFESLPTKHKVARHYHAFMLSLLSQISREMEKHRLDLEEEEALMNQKAQDGQGGYPWKRREEMKAKAISVGWRAVFAGGRAPSDPVINTRDFILAGIARNLIQKEGWLLAFDEVQLVDIAGAGIIRHVLEWYFRLGGVVIATSNRIPEDLYNQGVHRESIQDFLHTLQARCPVVALSSSQDYRRTHRSSLSGEPASNAFPLNSKGWYTYEDSSSFDSLVKELEAGKAVNLGESVSVFGRSITIPRTTNGVAYFSFTDLCEQPLGPADYLTIASKYHTIVLDHIPVLNLSAKNEARRFITFIDSVYETRTRLLCRAEAAPDDMFFPDAMMASGNATGGTAPSDEAGTNSLFAEMIGDVVQDLEAPYRPNVSTYEDAKGSAHPDTAPQVHPSASVPAFQTLAIFTGQDERFAFARAVSRLHEMSSSEYLRDAVWCPIDASLRTWERPFSGSWNDEQRRRDAHSKQAFESSDLLEAQTEENGDSANRPPPPKFKEEHVWGVRDDWGKRAGLWGQGTKIHQK